MLTQNLPSRGLACSSKSSPCQICGNSDGRCRESDRGVLCMVEPDGDQTPTGWQFNGRTRDDQWGQYSPVTTDSTPEKPHPPLSLEDRDRLYRELLSRLTLDPSDRADLERRGLSAEQIKAGLFRSVVQWQPLSPAMPVGLPGVIRGGKSLNVQSDGYLCPAFNVDGLIQGMQIRLREAGDGGRYRWLSSRTQKNPDGAQPHVDGELPLTIALPDSLTRPEINLAEGILKPWIAAERMGLIFVGASGGNFSASQKSLEYSLNRLSTTFDTKKITFWQDAGALQNPHVERRDRKTWALLQSWGYEVSIAWWNQGYAEKSTVPDCDELDDQQIEYLSVADYEERFGVGPVEEPRRAAVDGGQGTLQLTYVADEETGREEFVQQSIAAGEFQRVWGETLVWNTITESYWQYENGVWREQPEILIQQRVQAELSATDLGYSASYATGIFKLLRGELASDCWTENRNLIPFKNGVLNIELNTLSDHSPEHRLLWQLPYNYTAIAVCDPIIEWLRFTQNGDEQRVQLLRAYLKAVVCGRVDLQRFAELIGPGGTGKSTFVNLAIALIGIQNVHVTDLKRLETNRFESANIFGKRLVYITDSERYAGEVSTLKSLTGQDPIPFERKHKHAQASFVPRAMVVLAANEPISSADNTSGLQRRRLTIPFTRTIDPAERRTLIEVSRDDVAGEFAPYIPGLLNWVLAMPDAEMRSLIVDTDRSVPSLSQAKQESLIATNPLAAWLEECCVFAPGARTKTGVATKIRLSEGSDGHSESYEIYNNQDNWLYANYKRYCDVSGAKAVSIKRFGDLLIDLCQNQLKVPGVTRGKDRDGAYFEGIALRGEEYKDLPSPISGESSVPAQAPTPQHNSEGLGTPTEFAALSADDRAIAQELILRLFASRSGGQHRDIWYRRDPKPLILSRAAQEAVWRYLEGIPAGQAIIKNIKNIEATEVRAA
jgi:P4 family phage/plasmid primase-like protien